MAAVQLTALSEPPSWLSSSLCVLLNSRTVIGCDWSAGLWVQILMWTPPKTRMSLFLGRTLTPRLKDTSKTSEWNQERSHWKLSSLYLSFKNYVLQPWTLTPDPQHGCSHWGAWSGVQQNGGKKQLQLQTQLAAVSSSASSCRWHHFSDTSYTHTHTHKCCSAWCLRLPCSHLQKPSERKFLTFTVN